MNDIKRWLEDLDLGRYVEAFQANAIDVELLPDLDEADLEKMGVAALGHPNSLKIGANTAAHHIEILLLNVFQKF